MAFTVTATQGGSTGNGLILRIFVLTQAAATQNGATANTAFSTATATFTLPITTTQTGSRVYGAANHGTSATTDTAAALTTLVDTIADATNGERYQTFKATSLTGTPGATTLGFTINNTQTGSLAMAEIKTAGTLTEDASAPAVASTLVATTVTTASFTPPAGSLLVALIGSDGGVAVTTMAVTDTSGLGLTWVEQSKNNASSFDYAGVWIAQVPGGGGAVPAAVLPAQPGLTWRRRFRHPQQLVTPALSGPQTILGSASISGAGVTFAGSFVPPQQPQAAALAYVTRKPPGRARVGRRGETGAGQSVPRLLLGVASAAGAGAVTANAVYIVPVPQRPQTAASVYVARKPPGRALAGRGAVAGGITGPQPPSAGLGVASAAGAGAVTATVTQGVIAAAAGAGAATAAATQTATAAAAGAGAAATAVVTQIAVASAAGAGSVFAVPVGFTGGAPSPGVPVVIGRPNLARARTGRTTTGGGIAVRLATVTQFGTASIAGAGVVSASGVIPGTASITGAGAATAAVTQAATASPAGAGALAALATQRAVAALTGAGAATAAGNIQLAFTVGTLTSATAPAATLTAATAASGGAAGGTLTATDTRTGGPS